MEGELARRRRIALASPYGAGIDEPPTGDQATGGSPKGRTRENEYGQENEGHDNQGFPVGIGKISKEAYLKGYMAKRAQAGQTENATAAGVANLDQLVESQTTKTGGIGQSFNRQVAANPSQATNTITPPPAGDFKEPAAIQTTKTPGVKANTIT